MREMTNSYDTLFAKLDGECLEEDNIKMYLKGIFYGVVNRIYVAYDKRYRRYIMKIMMEFAFQERLEMS